MAKHLSTLIAAVAAANVPSAASAQIVGSGIVSDSGDTGFLIAASLIALIAVLPGWALYQAGRLRAAHAVPAAGLMFGIVAVVSLLWLTIGYSLAFNGASPWLGYGQNAWLANLGNIREGTTVPESAFALLNLVFALAAPLLIAGALAERVRTGWMLAFAGLWSLIVYAPIAHWIWGNGWLGANGALDFSGGLVVFVAAGVSALVAAVMLGRRSGWPDDIMPGHAPILSLAGTALGWVGWLALAGAGALAATDDASAAVINMQIGASAGVVGWLICSRLLGGRIELSGGGAGALAGIAALASSSAYIATGPAMLIGFVAAVLSWLVARSIARTFRIDDVTGSFATGAIGGATGAILLAVFQSPSFGGVGYGEGLDMAGQVFAQLVALGAVALWSIIGTLIAGYGIAMVLPMRLTVDDEATP
ncbi:MAG: ammonium transporter [Sphingomonadales bacterium]|nr:ammonium transporter [Sphingomonadales bacterium]